MEEAESRTTSLKRTQGTTWPVRETALPEVLIRPRKRVRRRKSQAQMAMGFTGQKPTQSAREGECSQGLPGSTKRVGGVERSARNVGGPGGSWTLERAGRDGKRYGSGATDGEPQTRQEAGRETGAAGHRR